MRIKLLVSAAAIALALTIGSASAGDRFTTPDGLYAEPVSTFATLNGLTTEPMNRAEMAAVRGSFVGLVKVDGVTRASFENSANKFGGTLCIIVTTGGGGVSFTCP